MTYLDYMELQIFNWLHKMVSTSLIQGCPYEALNFSYGRTQISSNSDKVKFLNLTDLGHFCSNVRTTYSQRTTQLEITI